MADDLDSVKTAMDEMRRFFVEVSTMLQTLDAGMAAEHWTPIKSEVKRGSNAVDKPRDWLPYYLYRLYGQGSEDEPISFIKALGVLFDLSGPDTDDVRLEIKSSFHEPIVTCSHFDLAKPIPKEGKEGISGKEWIALYPIWSSQFDIEALRDIIEVEEDQFSVRKHNLPISSIHGFTLRLGEIEGMNFDDKVLSRLLSLPAKRS